MDRSKGVFVMAARTVVITLAFYFIAFSSASWAELKGNYHFQNNLKSSVPGAPDLVDLGSGSFSTANVNGVDRTVFNFFVGLDNDGEGLRLNTNGLIPNDAYTVVMLFEFDDPLVGNYGKILDFANLTLDEGLYDFDGFLNFYNEAISPTALFTPGIFAQVVLTRDPSGNVVGYFDGVQEFAFIDSSNFAEISSDDFLIFFRDDDQTGNDENSPGSVACIQVYDEPLSASDIANLDCLAVEITTSPIPTISEWGMIVIAGFLGFISIYAIRRRLVSQ
jgi:hypothetical protein